MIHTHDAAAVDQLDLFVQRHLLDNQVGPLIRRQAFVGPSFGLSGDWGDGGREKSKRYSKEPQGSDDCLV